MEDSHRKSSTSGEDSLTERVESIIATELQNFQTAEILPILTDWGVQDEGVCIHSLGVTFLTILGHRLGYVAVAEMPAPKQGKYAHVGDDVRSDSVWFDRASRYPLLIAEFERYNGFVDKTKLEGKVNNLLLAQHRWNETAELLMLAYWTKGLVSLPEHAELGQIIKRGFETQAKERVFGCMKGKLVFFQFVMRETRDGLLHLAQIIHRGTL